LGLEGVRARGPQDRAATRQNAPCGLDRELHVRALEGSAPAVPKAQDRVAVVVDALADDRPDHRVQAGTVTTAGENADAHPLRNIPGSSDTPPAERSGTRRERPRDRMRLERQ